MRRKKASFQTNCGKVIFISEVAFIDGVQTFECSAVSHTNSKRLLPLTLYSNVLYWTALYGTILYCFLSFHRYLFSMGLFLLVTIAFWTGHSVARYVRSLAPLTPLTRSAALRFATLASLARSVHGLAHSLRSLPRGTVEIHESVFMLKSRTMGTNVIFVITRNTPYMC